MILNKKLGCNDKILYAFESRGFGGEIGVGTVNNPLVL